MQSNKIESNQKMISSTAETKKNKKKKRTLRLITHKVRIFPVRQKKKKNRRNEIEKKE